MFQNLKSERFQMSWYGPGPARPAMPPMGFGQGPPMSNMVPWGPPGGMPPGGMPPRPQYQAPAPQPHFEQRPKRVRLCCESLELLKLSISYLSIRQFQLVLQSPALWVTSQNELQTQWLDICCLAVLNLFHQVRHLLTTAGPVVSWKRVQGATGKLQVSRWNCA